MKKKLYTTGKHWERGSGIFNLCTEYGPKPGYIGWPYVTISWWRWRYWIRLGVVLILGKDPDFRFWIGPIQIEAFIDDIPF